LVDRNVYLSILTVGVIFAVLSLFIEQPNELALTILFITTFVLFGVKWIEDWRYYRHYNAPLASAIFLVLPSIIGILGSYLASSAIITDERILQTRFLEITLDFSFFGLNDFYLFLNLFSIVFVVPSLCISTILLIRFYSGRYAAIFIFRKRFPNTLVIITNFFMSAIFIAIWFNTNLVELSGLIFVIISISLFINYYVMKVVIVPFKRVSQSRVRRRTPSSDPSSRPFFSWEVPREPQRTRQSPSRPSSRTSGSVTVAPAVTVSRRKPAQKLTPAILSSLRPAGQHLTEDDFKCIFCYEFPLEPNRQVVICPHCHHPSHENEYQKWSAVADICSRCNKKVSNEKMIRLSGKNYERIIKMFRNNQLK